MYKFIFFVPKASCEQVKSAVFQAGAGKIGNYSHCSWQVLGKGQFQPNEGATPAIGSVFKLEEVEEYRVEMVCADHKMVEVVKAMKQAHPYEEPAYEVIRLEDF